MGVRFVVGRAGSGKTFRALQAVRAELAAEPRGPRLILLVPEQAALQMERALVTTAGLAGFTRCEVWSFRRLARRVMEELGGAALPEIDATGRQMVLRHLVARLGERLSVFAPVIDRPGFIEKLAATIVELQQQTIDPEALLAAAGDLADRPTLTAKLRDLGLVFRAYLDWLKGRLLDPQQYLDLLRERLDECTWLGDSRIWVEGFAGFTGQEEALLVELARRAESVEISLLIDPHVPVLDRPDRRIDELGLFARTERTFQDLSGALREAGVEIESVVRLAADPPRFAGNPELGHLEKNLFSARPKAWPDAPRTIQVVEAANRRDEADAVAAEIRRLVLDEALRYRDIAVVVRDLEPYHDLLGAALIEHGIPCFIDRRRPMTHHPLIELLRAAVAAAQTNWALDPMRHLMKTDLLGIGRDQLDALENYALGHGICGEAWFSRDDWPYRRQYTLAESPDEPTEAERVELQAINRTRRTLADRLAPWRDDAEAQSPTGLHWARACWSLLERLEVARQLSAWADEAEACGRIEQQHEHRRVFSSVVGLLDALAAYLGDEPMDVAGFRAVLEAALAGLDLGLTPPTLDQVLVGSIERSRHPEVKAVLLVGFTQQGFPLAASEDPVFRDSERKQLALAGLKLARDSEQRFLDERMLAYIAMTRPSRRLWISYPAADEEGRTLLPSAYLTALTQAFPRLATRILPSSDRADEAAGNDAHEPFARATTVARLAAELVDRIRRRAGDLRPAEAAVFDWACRDPRVRPVLARVAAALGYENRPDLDGKAAAATFGSELRTGVSRLESFAACPFQHFARYVLKLEPRAEYAVQPVDLGALDHYVLARFAQTLIAEPRTLAELPDDQIVSRLEAITTEAAGRVRHELLLSTARNRQLARQARRRLAATLKAGRFFARAGKFRPRYVEWSFGLDSEAGSLPPLCWTTPKGRTVVLRGRIDRVDLAECGDELSACVIDYKRSSGRTLSLVRAYHGLDLQLLAYLLAVDQLARTAIGRPVSPAGAFYVSLLQRYRTIKHPDEIDPDEAAAAARVKPRGVFDVAAIGLFDSELQTGQSQVVNAFLKRDGTLGHRARSDAVESHELRGLLDHAARTMARLADDVCDGRIDVSPYLLAGRSPCRWCEMSSVCRFELGVGGGEYRVLENLTPEAVLEAVTSGADAE